MINLHNLQGDIVRATEFTKSGIAGETQTYQIYSGKHHQKNLTLFKLAKWSTRICSILLVCYIIYKIIL